MNRGYCFLDLKEKSAICKIVDGYSEIAPMIKVKSNLLSRDIWSTKSGSCKIPLHSDQEEQLTKCEVSMSDHYIEGHLLLTSISTKRQI